ncbi:hypothetical protein QE390_002507 [Siphonobacter sp. SORGH_AS 1065]|nr:hypothetical protein [Siphonobacter sp. SORGH_AS_1065]
MSFVTSIYQTFSIMKKNLLTGLILISSLGASAQASKTFNVSNFDQLDLGSAFIIDVHPGKFKVEVEGQESDINDLEAKVSNGKLRIRYNDSDRYSNRKRVEVHITMPALKGVSFSGASRSSITGFGAENQMSVDISGASQASIEVKAKTLDVDVSGASNVTLTGNTQKFQGNISGASSFKAEGLEVSQATIDVSGASNARLYVKEKLSAEASGASRVRYRGNPSVNANTSGASSVRNE